MGYKGDLAVSLHSKGYRAGDPGVIDFSTLQQYKCNGALSEPSRRLLSLGHPFVVR